MSESAPTVVVVNPNTTSSMTALIERTARSAAAPGTHVRARTSGAGPVSIESHYDEAMSVPGMLEVLRSEPDADAFVLACFGDPGLDAAREVAQVPVIGIAEAGFKIAATLVPRFSVVTTVGRTLGRARELVHRYGAERQCAGVHACELAVLDLETDPDLTYETVLTAAKSALARDSSDGIVLGCAGMADLPDRLSRSLGVPVVDGVAAGMVLAEGMARLGYRAGGGEYAPPPPKQYTGWLSGYGS